MNPRTLSWGVAVGMVAMAGWVPAAAADWHNDPTQYVFGQCPSDYPFGVYVKGQYNLCCKQPGPNLKDWLVRVLFQGGLEEQCIWV